MPRKPEPEVRDHAPSPGADTETMAHHRILPQLSPDTERFWTSGAGGRLQIPRCGNCHRWLHPSLQTCPHCHGTDVSYAAVSGRGTVVAVTVNHHPWIPGVPLPYGIVIVALDEDPSIRLTSNVLHVMPDDLYIGMRVSMAFEPHGEIYLPLFEPEHSGPVDDSSSETAAGGSAITGVFADNAANPAANGEPTSALSAEPSSAAANGEPRGALSGEPMPSIPEFTTRPPASPYHYEHAVALTGIGMSSIGRRLMRPPIALAVEASLAAVADAGLSIPDIDGLSTYPGPLGASGHSEGGIAALEEALRTHPTWHNGVLETPGQTGSVVAAMLAVASGLCRHVLCVRTVWEATHAELVRRGELGQGPPGSMPADMQWRLPYGAASPANWIALHASQYLHRYNAGRDTLGWIAIVAREHAAKNPAAIYRSRMDMDEYMNARIISTPFGLYDCDAPCDGAIAVIVSAKETAKDMRKEPVLVDAAGTAVAERISWDQGTITHLPNVFGPARHLWTRTTLTPGDVDVAELYDGFTFNCLSWLEAMGFCEVGEGKDFLDGGDAIRIGGALPVNTHGGQLSAGRTHGYGFLHEAIVQLRGEGGERQVQNAQVAAVAVGGGVPAGCFLLTIDH